MNYWKNQTVVDVLVAALTTAALWLLPSIGSPVLFVADADALVSAFRSWVAPTLTLLGMMAATTAFIFTVIDREEFGLLRKSKSEAQLWRIFSENVLWLGVAAVFCAIATFWNGNWPVPVIAFSTFLLIMAVISILKFVWIMRQIISVRIGQADLRAP